MWYYMGGGGVINGVGYVDWLMQERRNSIANAPELRLADTNPSI